MLFFKAATRCQHFRVFQRCAASLGRGGCHQGEDPPLLHSSSPALPRAPLSPHLLEDKERERGRKHLHSGVEIMAVGCRQGLVPRLWGCTMVSPSLPCYETHPGVTNTRKGTLSPRGPWLLRLPLSTLEGNIIPLQDSAIASAGPLHQHLQALCRRFPSHFPKLRERKRRQFSIFLYQLLLLLWGARSSLSVLFMPHLTNRPPPCALRHVPALEDRLCRSSPPSGDTALGHTEPL